MEANWIEALRNTPLPNAGSLTDRALAQVKPRPRYAGRTLVLGSLALAATLPLAAFFLKVPTKKSEAKISESNLTRFQSNVKSFESDLTNFQSDLMNFQSDTKHFESDVKNVESDLTNFQSDVKRVKSKVKNVESKAIVKEPTQVAVEPTAIPSLDPHVSLSKALPSENRSQLWSLSEQSQNRLGLNRGLSAAFAFNESRTLSLLPNTRAFPGTQANLVRQADGHVEGTLTFVQDNLRLGLIPQKYDADVALYDHLGQLVATTKAELPGDGGTVLVYSAPSIEPTYYQVQLTPQRSWSEELEVAGGSQLFFRPQSEPLSRYQLAVTKAPQDDDVSFTVATVETEKDGALLLLPKRPEVRIEDALKNPKLRDYTQVKLTASVVAALKEKGITTFVGRRLHAKGKSEEALYLSQPAFVVTTMTVSTPEDLQLTQDYLHRLREAQKAGSGYELLIAPEFNEVLLAAADRGDDATVIELVQRSWFGGPESAAKGGNAITWAAYCPTAEPVRRLLARNTPPGVADSEGTTGLHRTYREEIARLLLERGAPVEVRNKDGETPLIQQARQCDRWLGHAGVIHALLEHRANPNATDRQGKTALMHAAQRGMVEVVEALLKAGANPKTKDKSGKTAYDYTAPWAWQSAPGFQTEEGLMALEKKANADAERIRALLSQH